MTCVRADGSVTGQRLDERGFYIRHDMTHYAIETTLDLRSAFYGMLAYGWDIGDFGSPWPRGPIPPHAQSEVALAEHLAGAFDRERYVGMPVVAEEQNLALLDAVSASEFPVRAVSEAEVDRIRERLAELQARWDALPVGNTLEVSFP